MTEPAGLFRQEALDFWTRQRGPGPLLRIVAPWVRWLYGMVLVLTVAGVALAFSVRVEQTISGAALVNGQERTFVALLPAAPNADLRPGQPLRIEVEVLRKPRQVPAQIRRVGVADDADIRRAGFGSFPQPAILVIGVLAPRSSDLAGLPSSRGLRGRAVVVLRSERALAVFLRGFKGVWEGGDT